MTPRAQPHIFHLITEGCSPQRIGELKEAAAAAEPQTVEILEFTESNSREVLEKIFAATTVAVWGPLVGESTAG